MAALDEAIASLVGDAEADEAPNESSDAALGEQRDVAAARETFVDLSKLYMAQVRDVMMEIRWADAPKTMAARCLPAVESLRSMADKMDLDDLKAALAEFAKEASRVRRSAAIESGDGHDNSLWGAYDALIELMPGAFELDGERNRREPIIVESLLRQVPGVREHVIDSLSTAGLTSLEMFSKAEAPDVSAAAAIPLEVAEAILERFREYRRSAKGGLSAPDLGDEQRLLRAKLATLEERRRAVAEARDRSRRRDLRRAIASVWLEAVVSLARLGEVDLAVTLRALPMRARIERLDEFLSWLSAQGSRSEVEVGTWQPQRKSPSGDLSSEEVIRRAKNRKPIDRTDLCGIELANARLDGASFRRSDIDGANLGGARLRRAIFVGASLREAYLAGADLAGANLENADLEGATLEGADLTGAVLSRVNLEGANLRGAQLVGAHLDHADLSDADLERADLSRAVLTHADLEDAYLGGAVVRGVDATGANLYRSNLERADLGGAKLDEAHLAAARAVSARFAGASLRRAVLTGCGLRDADLSGADLRRANIEGAQLEGARITGAKVAGLLGTGAPLEGVEAEWVDTSVDGSGLKKASGPQVVAELSGIPLPEVERAPKRRFFGQGDVLRHATLEFEPGARVEIESLLRDCSIELGDDAELVIGPAGVLADCRIAGRASVTVLGKFFERESPGIVYPKQIIVGSRGVVVGTILQVNGGTRFAFAPGSTLRLKIRTDSATQREERES